MAALVTQTYNVILTGIPASALTAETVWGWFRDHLQPGINEAMSQGLDDAIAAGKTIRSNRANIFNQSAATLICTREWTTVADANERVTWYDANLEETFPTPPADVSVPGYSGTVQYVHVSNLVQDNQSITQTGNITNP
jgi:hypothetical protein